ncbi:MAG: mRNA surveillance protein pelota [Candidatus Altiarchaeales archaeon]|nr:mRNA surveillance protein pelota [Candidatus Altiarchaeales archaeon]
MKVLFKDLRRGIVKLLVESLDDLWYLSQIVQERDLVESKTTRKVKGKEEGMDAERRTVTLEIKVEKLDFKSDSNVLKVLGIVSHGPEDVVSLGTHHSFNIGVDDVISVRKERWLDSDLSRLKDAVDSSLRPKVLIAVIDEGEASFGLVRASRIEHSGFSSAVGGKFDLNLREKRKTEFYNQVLEHLQNTALRESVHSIIVAGAGFEKEHFMAFLSEKNPELAKKTVLEHIGSHGVNGVNEVLKRPVLKKVLEDINSALDVNLVNKLLEHIGKDDGFSAYGMQEIRNAITFGAVEILLISDKTFVEQRKTLEELMNSVRNSRGRVHIVNQDSEAGRQLKALGGIAGILRFRVK